MVAHDRVPLDHEVEEMIVNRLIDNTAVAIAAINRKPVANARTQALAHPRPDGATVYGLPIEQRFCAEWAAWANGTAVRELDFHDTFLAADYAHPGDAIAPLLAVAQQMQVSGNELLSGIATAYEIHIGLVKGICLHQHKIDHMAHLAPAVVAGLGTLLRLEPNVTYQAVQQAVHTSFTTRQSRKGEISSWKAYVPGYAGKLAIEAVDRAMRGEMSPSPIYEGEDSVIAWLLDGPEACYEVAFPEAGESKRAILESYTKAHSAEYQAQAVIDLAFDLRTAVSEEDAIEEVVIHTSHHTHVVIGSGSNDPQKYDPQASRETLDHSIMYIFTIAFQDGRWHHEESYTRARATRADTVRLWNKVKTVEDPEWTRRYHHPEPNKRAFGSRVEVRLAGGSTIERELAVANAHPNGKTPFERTDYLRKFTLLTQDLITPREHERYLGAVQRLGELHADELALLNVEIPKETLLANTRDERGIF